MEDCAPGTSVPDFQSILWSASGTPIQFLAIFYYEERMKIQNPFFKKDLERERNPFKKDFPYDCIFYGQPLSRPDPEVGIKREWTCQPTHIKWGSFHSSQLRLSHCILENHEESFFCISSSPAGLRFISSFVTIGCFYTYN